MVIALVLHRGECGGGNERAARPRSRGTRDLSRRWRGSKSPMSATKARGPSGVPARRPHHRQGPLQPTRMMFLGGDGAGKAPRQYLVEFRLLQQGADRTGQTGLEKPGRFCRRSAGARVHSAAGVGYLPLYPAARHPARPRLSESCAHDPRCSPANLPLPRIGRGKVRDIYAVGDDRGAAGHHRTASARSNVVMAENHPDEGCSADAKSRRSGSTSWKAVGAASHDERRCGPKSSTSCPP